MNNELSKRLNSKIVIFDGAMGTELYKRNFFVNASYENVCLIKPQVVQEIHQAYKNAGAEVMTTNSYGANFNKLNKFGLGDKVEEICAAAARLARKVAGPDLMVAGSIGPVGEPPEGKTFTEQEETELLSLPMSVLEREGVDFLLFETISTEAELRAALRAVKANPPGIPFVISCTFTPEFQFADGFSMDDAMALIHASDPAPTALGLNCGCGPEPMLGILEKIKDKTTLPIIVQPNAGAPKKVDDRTFYLCATPEYFTTYCLRFAALGARGIGGCCGTTPEVIHDMARSVNPFAKIESHQAIFTQELENPEQEEVPLETRSSFAKKLCSGQWVYNVEVVPPQGFELEQTIEKAKLCREFGFDAINIPDGPRASSRVSSLVTAFRIQEAAGIEPILHQCCRDKNLIGMQAELLGCAALHINNILFITGDPPKLGDYPFASGVFDIDSIGMLKLQTRLNRGLDLAGKPIPSVTQAFPGAGADPNAIDMAREIRRTREKIQAGAKYIVTQPVFDVNALLRFMDAVPELQSVPLIAGIWPLASLRNAEFMRKEVPGVVVPDSVMIRMGEAQTKEEQRSVGIQIAREAIAAIRGKVAGVQISAPFGNVRTAAAVMRGEE